MKTGFALKLLSAHLALTVPLYANTTHADAIVIVKSTHTLTLYSHGQALREYKVSLGRGPVGPKVQQGDHKTPEGHYIVDLKNDRSQFHLALHISYPNAHDIAEAKRLNRNPGGAVEIHGLPDRYGWIGSIHRVIDWTDGCIAVTNQEIEEIWNLVPVQTPVDIRP